MTHKPLLSGRLNTAFDAVDATNVSPLTGDIRVVSPCERQRGSRNGANAASNNDFKRSSPLGLSKGSFAFESQVGRQIT